MMRRWSDAFLNEILFLLSFTEYVWWVKHKINIVFWPKLLHTNKSLLEIFHNWEKWWRHISHVSQKRFSREIIVNILFMIAVWKTFQCMPVFFKAMLFKFYWNFAYIFIQTLYRYIPHVNRHVLIIWGQFWVSNHHFWVKIKFICLLLYMICICIIKTTF